MKGSTEARKQMVPQLGIMATVASLQPYAYLTLSSMGPNVFHTAHCRHACRLNRPRMYQRCGYARYRAGEGAKNGEEGGRGEQRGKLTNGAPRELET